MADAWGRGYRSGQGLRRGILLGLRESAKSIAAGSELAVGSDSCPCRNNADSRRRGSDELGKLLMKSFLFAVSQLPRLPRTVLFYNGGAKLTVEGSESLEDLRNMEAQGVEILTCGTCLNFYGLAEKLAVGGVTNMYAIVEALANAGKVIKP